MSNGVATWDCCLQETALMLGMKQTDGVALLCHRWISNEFKDRQDNIILLSGLRPITTGVNIQAIRILMDPMTDLNSVF